MERRVLPIPGSPEMSASRHSASIGLFEQLRQPRALRGPSHEAARRHLLQAGRQRQRWPFFAEWFPADVDGIERLGKPFQVEPTDRREGAIVSSGREMGDDLLGEDPAAVGAVAKARRLDHRHAEVITVGHSHVPDAETHFDQELVVASAVAALEALLHRNRARDSLRGAVKGGDQAVARVLHLLPARLTDFRAEEREVLAPKRICGCRPNPRLQRGGTDQVGDKDRDCLNGTHPPVRPRPASSTRPDRTGVPAQRETTRLAGDCSEAAAVSTGARSEAAAPYACRYSPTS